VTVANIHIRGARTHNLKSMNLDLPRDKLIVITGVSGSGKSSLAFDTIYAEGQRRYVESLSTYARQFLSMMKKPDVDLIDGLSPAISIEQKSSSHNPRSTVGTVTEIHDYLRLLFARIGEPKCPKHSITLQAQTVSQMVDKVMAQPAGTWIMLLSPVVNDRKGEFQQLIGELHAQGFIRALIDKKIVNLNAPPKLDKRYKHSIEVIVDRVVTQDGNQQRLAESFETALNLANGTVKVTILGKNKEVTETILFSNKFACPYCEYSLNELEPRLFSFNNPAGACENCDGLGVKQFFDLDRIIQDPKLSLSAGAIPGWDRRSAYYSQLCCLADHYQFDINTPFNSLPTKVQNRILYGSGDEMINFVYTRLGRKFKKRHIFEGVINNLDRRYRETDSSSAREELAKYYSTNVCNSCNGSRLRTAARNVFIDDQTIQGITVLPVGKALEFFQKLNLEGWKAKIAEKIVLEINTRLEFLINVGLNYLSLSRAAETLSGGEAQRIRLASQIGSGLLGVMYILDEPSIGLHQRDNTRLLDTLFHLRNLGNTVIVVEHDEETILSADHVVDIGPGAGKHGGTLVAQGKPSQIKKNKQSITGQYLSRQMGITVPEKRTSVDPDRQLRVTGAIGNNLKKVCAELPIGLFTCITGVSGSGKSTLVNGTLYPAVAQQLNLLIRVKPEPYESIEGLEYFDKIISIDQSPIGRTPRSNPSTYTGLFTHIREIFTNTQEARVRGYKPGRFSFNVKGGRCEACQGNGLIRVEMHFLPDIYVPCDICKGNRYNRETLDIHYKGKNISEVLEMTIEEAADFFSAIPNIKRKIETLLEVGLGYIMLGQSANTLSGGEAQRVKLSRELSKRNTGRTLYVLDEPTTGLHFHDVQQLLRVLHKLRDHGNTIIVIEHNLEVIKTADWIIDLGPEGGDRGGKIIASGTPEQVSLSKNSFTGQYLKAILLKSGNKK